MRRSIDRVLTTHVGSLPRPAMVAEGILNLEAGEAVDESELAAAVRQGVSDVVRRQFEVGLDFVSDGEFSKPAFVRYVKHRLTGFDGVSSTPSYADLDDFEEFRNRNRSRIGRAPQPNPACDGPVAPKNKQAVIHDIANLRAALGERDAGEAFVPCASPGVICMNLDNHYYATHEHYLNAVADAMRHEYETIANAGLVVQLDCPAWPWGGIDISRTRASRSFARTRR